MTTIREALGLPNRNEDEQAKLVKLVHDTLMGDDIEGAHVVLGLIEVNGLPDTPEIRMMGADMFSLANTLSDMIRGDGALYTALIRGAHKSGVKLPDDVEHIKGVIQKMKE
jgi:hypothetical protein